MAESTEPEGQATTMKYDRSDLRTGFEDLEAEFADKGALKVPEGVTTQYNAVTLANEVEKIKNVIYNTPDPSDTSKRVWTTQLSDPKCRKLHDDLVNKAIFANQGKSSQGLYLVLPIKSSEHYAHAPSVAGALGITTTNFFDLLSADYHAKPQGPIFHLCSQEEDCFQIDKDVLNLDKDRNALHWAKFNTITREMDSTRDLTIRQLGFQPENTPIPLPLDDDHPKWKATDDTQTRLLESAVLGVYHTMKTYKDIFVLTKDRLTVPDDQRELPQDAYHVGLFGYCQDEWYNGWCVWRFAMHVLAKDKNFRRKEAKKSDVQKKANKKKETLFDSYDEAIQYYMSPLNLNRRNPSLEPYYYTSNDEHAATNAHDTSFAPSNPVMADDTTSIGAPQSRSEKHLERAVEQEGDEDHAMNSQMIWRMD